MTESSDLSIAKWHPSPNFGRTIRYVILHGTGKASDEEALNWFCDPRTSVSCHYLIFSTGETFQLVRDKDVAWHAGESTWKGEPSLNYVSIGIELFNRSAGARDDYSIAQYDSLIRVLQELIEKYDIPIDNVLGHSDVSPQRRSDPGPRFDWRILVDAGVASQDRLNGLTL